MSSCNAGDLSLISGSGRSPGEGNGSPFQYFCLENPRDRGAWWATSHGVTKSWTRLSDFHSLVPKTGTKIKRLLLVINHRVTVGIVFTVHINEIHSILKVTFDFSSSAIYFSYGLKDVRIWKDNCGRVFCVRTCTVGLEHTGMCVCVYIYTYTK